MRNRGKGGGKEKEIGEEGGRGGEGRGNVEERGWGMKERMILVL